MRIKKHTSKGIHPGEESPEVQNWGISCSIERTYVHKFYFKK